MSSTANDQWGQYFYHQSMESGDVASSIEFSDSMITTTGTTPSNSSSTSAHYHHHLSPKGCGSKAVKRRSRASKKTPTTLLNANTTNFRALVQQFTGCPSTSFSFGSSNKKGPVNLSFGLGSSDYDQQQNQKYGASVTAAFGNNDNHFYQQQYQPQKHFQQQEQQYRHQQVLYQDQQSLVSYQDNNVISGSDSMTNSRLSGNYLEIPDVFDMDETSMHETIRAGSAFSSEDRSNSYFL